MYIMATIHWGLFIHYLSLGLTILLGQFLTVSSCLAKLANGLDANVGASSCDAIQLGTDWGSPPSFDSSILECPVNVLLIVNVSISSAHVA